MKAIYLPTCTPVKIWQAGKILLLLLIFISSKAVAQQQKILAMNVETTIPAGDTTQFGIPLINDSLTLFSTVMNVVLNGQQDSILKLHIRLGNTIHGSEYLSAAFDFDVPGNFGSLSYTINGNGSILLGLGVHTGMINYYAEIQVENLDNTLEDPVLYSNN